MSRERELEERIRHLEEINDQKDRMLGVIVHELRNPLAAIRSAAEVLRLTLGNEPRVQKTYGIVDRQTMSMVKLLDRMGDVSKIARGKITLDCAVLDLGQILTRTLEQSSTAPVNHVPLNVLWVNADAARLQQVFECSLRGAAQVSAEKDAGQAVVRFESEATELDPLAMKLVEGLISLHGGTVTARNEGRTVMLELRIPLAEGRS